MRISLVLIGILILQAGLAIVLEPQVAAHLTGGVTKIVGKYKIQFLVIPKYPVPDENATLNFSIQDLNSNNLSNVTLRIIMTLANLTVYYAPSRVYPYGDFLINFVFPQEGQYTLSITVFSDGNEYSTFFSVTISRLSAAFSEIYSELPVILWVSALLVLSVFLIRELRKWHGSPGKIPAKVSRKSRGKRRRPTKLLMRIALNQNLSRLYQSA